MIWSILTMWQFPELFLMFLPVTRAPYVDFPNPGHTLLPIFHSFRPMGMLGEACLPSNAYYPRTPDYTLYSGVHVCWSEHSDSSFIYGFMSLVNGLGTMTATTFRHCTSFKYVTRTVSVAKVSIIIEQTKFGWWSLPDVLYQNVQGYTGWSWPSVYT